MNGDRLDKIIDLVRAEFSEATANFGPCGSSNEGYAVILKELGELLEEIKKAKQ